MKRVIPVAVVGYYNAGGPSVLNDLPTVVKSLVTKVRQIGPHELFDRIPTGVRQTVFK